MDLDFWLSHIGNAARLFVEAVPEAFWIVYYWVRDWQSLIGGLLLIVAARIFSQGSIRAARLRATAMIRSAQIAAGVTTAAEVKQASPTPMRAAPLASATAPPTAESLLVQKLEQLRSLVRSAMSTLTSDAGKTDASPNFFCQRIALHRIEERELPSSVTPAALQLYRQLSSQLSVLRQLVDGNASNAELSQVLIQLNASAREFSSALTPNHAADVLRSAQQATAR